MVSLLGLVSIIEISKTSRAIFSTYGKFIVKVVIFTLQPRLSGIDTALIDQNHCPDLRPIDNTMPAPYWASSKALAKVTF
jgi:hypothetical protein